MKDGKEYEEFVVNVGMRVSELRTKRNYTRECLAGLADISTKFLYEIETGKKCCSAYILYVLTRSLQVSMGEFFKEESDAREIGGDTYNLRFIDNQKTEVNSLLQMIYEIVNKK